MNKFKENDLLLIVNANSFTNLIGKFTTVVYISGNLVNIKLCGTESTYTFDACNLELKNNLKGFL